jgi:AAA+ ATPase superfamily predicted ATPase
MEIIGREKEIKALKSYARSGKPEFVVVYGRRRVGKTFLVRELFDNSFCFYCTGRNNEPADSEDEGGKAMQRQLNAFHAALNKYGKETYEACDNWFDSFLQLEHLVENSDVKGKKVIFIDEMPWLDTPKSGFLSAFEYFWNSFASARPDILLIACGSATSWIVKKLFENTGGLFNRVTKQLHLEPFSLKECEDFFGSRGIVLNRYQIVESYMVFGGIPFYLDLFDSAYGLPQNIDRLCFGREALLRNEYRSLFATLFKNAENHHRIVAALSKKTAGMARDELLKSTGLSNGGRFTEALDDLELSGFVRRYNGFGKKTKGAIYQLTDPFTLFYHKFLKSGNITDPDYWTNGYASGTQNAWRGYAFEQVCLAHEEQIRRALSIGGVVANMSAWRSSAAPENGKATDNAQIDLVIDRQDQVINLCEMKFSVREFEISKAYCEQLERKARAFSEETRTRKALHMTLVTTYGVKRNQYYHAVRSEVTMDDLF